MKKSVIMNKIFYLFINLSLIVMLGSLNQAALCPEANVSDFKPGDIFLWDPSTTGIKHLGFELQVYKVESVYDGSIRGVPLNSEMYFDSWNYSSQNGNYETAKVFTKDDFGYIYRIVEQDSTGNYKAGDTVSYSKGDYDFKMHILYVFEDDTLAGYQVVEDFGSLEKRRQIILRKDFDHVYKLIGEDTSFTENRENFEPETSGVQCFLDKIGESGVSYDEAATICSEGIGENDMECFEEASKVTDSYYAKKLCKIIEIDQEPDTINVNINDSEE